MDETFPSGTDGAASYALSTALAEPITIVVTPTGVVAAFVLFTVLSLAGIAVVVARSPARRIPPAVETVDDRVKNILMQIAIISAARQVMINSLRVTALNWMK